MLDDKMIIKFENATLFKQFGIDWAEPEKAEENYFDNSDFELGTPQEDMDEDYDYQMSKYYRGINSGFERYLSFTDSDIKANVNFEETTFKIGKPKELLNWIVKCIDGYGEFYYGSATALKRAGPYTQKEAIESHFFWLKYYSDIYGRTSLSKTIEYALD